VPGAKERALRGRIKSVQSTKKITRAMELIAASRIVKAQQRVLAARPYAETITEVIQNVASTGVDGSHPLLAGHGRDSKVAYVVVSADRGLAGGYNASVIRMAENAIKAEQAEGKNYAIVCCGRKADGYFRYRKYNVEATFSGFSELPTYENAKQVAEFLLTEFLGEKYDRMELVYTQFLSAGSQIPVIKRLAPIDLEAFITPSEGMTASYEFEPEPGQILERLLPRYLESRLYAAFLDAAASEQAARQRAMKSATDNATELTRKLTRVMNQARQDSITTEIMEIVGGAEALRAGADDNEDLLIDTTHEEELFATR